MPATVSNVSPVVDSLQAVRRADNVFSILAYKIHSSTANTGTTVHADENVICGVTISGVCVLDLGTLCATDRQTDVRRLTDVKRLTDVMSSLLNRVRK